MEFEQFLRNEPELLKQYRLKHFASMKTARMPDTRYGLSIRLQPPIDFTRIEPSEAQGEFTASKQQGVEVHVQPSPDMLKPFLDDSWIRNPHYVTHLNQAFTNHTVFIQIDGVIAQPIVLHTLMKGSPFIQKICIHAKIGSSATVFLEKKSVGMHSGYTADIIQILTEPGSTMRCVTAQHVQRGVAVIQQRMSQSMKESSVEWIDLCLGGAYVRSEVNTTLLGEGASARNTILFLAADTQLFDLYTESRHVAPRTFSQILTKGVVNHHAKVLSRGLIRIEENAYGSDGYEKQDTLLLSDEAEADAIPNLEIHNHDVKCSHGSTVGQVDKEKLFYLMSRGLSRKEAERTIVEGYFTPVLEYLGDARKHVEKQLLERLRA